VSEELSQQPSPPEEEENTVKVEIDTSKIREEVAQTVQQILEAKKLENEDEDGKGEVDEGDQYMREMEEIAERLKSGSQLKEQWTVALPQTTKELAAHLRDYVFVSPVIRGKQGDTVNIPYVKDFDFEILASVGAAFSDSLGTIYGTTTATLKEAGGWARIPYKDIEKINANLLDEINQCFQRAAIRAEDKIICDAIKALTTSQFAGQINRMTATKYFYATLIPQAIGKLLEAGKEADPGDCIIYMTPAMYGALLEELSGSQPAAFATPQVLRTGRVVEYMGVRIVVGPAHITVPSGTTSGTYACAVLGRFKRAVTLAPKRELLIETEKDTVTRSLKITGSHTLAAKVVDTKELVRIITSEPA